MEPAIFLVLVAIASALGSITSGLLGWIDSNEPFNGRKFASTVITAIVAGIGFATVFVITPDMTLYLQILSLFLVFGSGFGADAARSKVSKAVATRQPTGTTTTTTPAR